MLYIRCAVDVFNKKKLDNSERVKQYEKHVTDPIFSGYDYLLALKDIRAFERKYFNKFEDCPSMSVNIYIFQTDGTVLPMQI